MQLHTSALTIGPAELTSWPLRTEAQRSAHRGVTRPVGQCWVSGARNLTLVREVLRAIADGTGEVLLGQPGGASHGPGTPSATRTAVRREAGLAIERPGSRRSRSESVRHGLRQGLLPDDPGRDVDAELLGGVPLAGVAIGG